jgi:hypothetical protein
MIKSFETTIHGGIAMPAYWTADRGTAVRAFPAKGDVSAIAGAAKRRSVDVAPVCNLTATTGVFVLEGAFPGTSGWSPPI